MAVARRPLSDVTNCESHVAPVDAMSIADNSMDFGYSPSVLHHAPDTLAGAGAWTTKLAAGAPFLHYLYYAFDNRPSWFRAISALSEPFRRLISRLPYRWRYLSSHVIAALVDWPLARTARLLDKLGFSVASLSYYRHRSFYVMRTDALDRFGTALEQRFARKQMEQMMRPAEHETIHFSEAAPFWRAVGVKSGIAPTR